MAEYPRPKLEPFSRDRRWSLGIGALALFEIDQIVFLVPWSSVSLGRSSAPSEPADGPGEFVALIFVFMLALALSTTLLGVIRLVGAFGVARGRRRGFLAVAIVSGVLAIPYLLLSLSLLGIPFTLADGAILVYCWRRLKGRIGPSLV